MGKYKPMDEAHTQALETRRRNAEARKALREAREAQEKQDKALILEALRAVLQDPEASSEQRIFAVSVLDNMQYYSLVPHALKYKGSDALIKDFARRVEAAQEAETN